MSEKSDKPSDKKPSAQTSKKQLNTLFDSLAPGEQKALINSMQVGSVSKRGSGIHFRTRSFKIGYYSDPHMGHKEFLEDLWRGMIDYFHKEGVDKVYCPGDNLEGMSGRPGHIYELTHIGFQNQVGYAEQMFNLASDITFHIIDGNHDLWFKDKNNAGAVPGVEIAKRCPNVIYHGEWEADIWLTKTIVMRLFHSGDGTAYADSYKLQKLIESFEGGFKPNIVLSGHYHKAVAIFRRNVFGFECGTLCGQTRWMRGKKIQAHKGFGIIEIWEAPEGGIQRLRHEFVPWYK